MNTTGNGSNRWGWMLAGLALLALVCIGGREQIYGQTRVGAREAQNSWEGLWPDPPALPWSGDATGASGWSRILDRPLDLRRKGRIGEQRRYRIRRQHLILDRQGHVIMRMVAEGTLKRVLLREDQPGLWAEHQDWERFASGQSEGTSAKPKLQEQEKARGIAYDFSPLSFDYINPPGDFARIPDPMAGYTLKVLAMDVTGFDAMLLTLRDRFGMRVRIGDMIRSAPQTQTARIGRDPEKEVGGSYRLGEATTTVAGITRCQGVPCALIWYSAEGNTVRQETRTPQLTLHLDGTEYFRTEMAVSLMDGHLVAAEVWGPVVSVTNLGTGKQPAQELPNTGLIQQVSMQEIR